MTRLKFDFRHRRLFVDLFGRDVYAVGGFVRDVILGRPAAEVDILVTGHDLNDIVARLQARGRVDLVGRSFGIIKFTVEGRTYDVAMPRRDRPAGRVRRGHKDFLIDTDPCLPVEKDLERRDFRTNSMALRLADGLLVDPFGGRDDTLKRRISLTNPAAFPEDPLRVLRAARFASVLEFRLDPAVYRAAWEVDLSGLSVERINDELFRLLLLSRRPSRGLDELWKLGALSRLFPELEALSLTIQDASFHPEKDAFGHHTVWAHTKLAVDQASALAGILGFTEAKKLALLLAALYHDAGKAVATRWELRRGRMVVASNGHDIQSERIARKVFQRFRIYSWNGFDLAGVVPLLIRTHHRAGELWLNRHEVTKKAFNRLAAEVNGEIELVVALDAADRAGRRTRIVTGLDREARWLLKRFAELRVNRETIRPLVMGRHLLELGVKPGPEMGRLLKRLYRLQLDGSFETLEDGVAAARRLLARGKR
jgi:tRNA nucleotidyltransferase (CCA-adding enzyme)